MLTNGEDLPVAERDEHSGENEAQDHNNRRVGFLRRQSITSPRPVLVAISNADASGVLFGPEVKSLNALMNSKVEE